jgi:hypothetical protein
LRRSAAAAVTPSYTAGNLLRMSIAASSMLFNVDGADGT